LAASYTRRGKEGTEGWEGIVVKSKRRRRSKQEE